MKRTISFLLAALVIAGIAKAEVLTDSIHSAVLGAWVKYNVYLPPSFNTDSRKIYPVLYLLHGLSDDYNSWVKKGRVQDVADSLLAAGRIKEMVILMPNAGGPDIFHTQNGYFNIPGYRYEDFFFQEFLPQAEKKYRIIGDKGHRAISGLSMGGGGSTVYAVRHPELFSSCYAMSAWLDFEMSIRANTDNCLLKTVNSVIDNSPIRCIEQATGETLAHLRTVKWFFDIGDDDNLLEQSERLHLLMRGRQVPAELRVRNGGHSWAYWHSALFTSLPFASQNFLP